MPQLLLELFSEEIPARMQQGAARDLERMTSERLKAAGLAWDALTTYAGPRRLTLVIEGLPASTPDRNEELKGPRTSAPEQALEGFLRKTGLTRDQLTERDGVWIAVIASQGRATTEVVAETVDSIVRAFPWPKSMRWGSGALRWVRPLKRIIAIFDGAVVPFEIDCGVASGSEAAGEKIVSGDVTEGHRFLGSGKPFAVKDFADYRQRLEREFVLLDVADRKLRILDAAKKVCADKGLALVDDDGLLDEVAGLAEWPTPILGDMDPQFLSLPPEVVRLSMKVHQKYFAVRDPSKHGLAPNFVVVANVEASDGGKALAAGNSRVLSARLNDARFFWDEDLKTGFDVWSKKLEGVTFHAKLGTLAERVERIAALAREIAPLVGADPDEAFEAARLSKADLASAMVGEFPELQGVMGGYYARLAQAPSSASRPLPPTGGDHDQHSSPAGGGGPRSGGGGWTPEVRDRIADAVRDHYKPQGPADTVPTAPLTVAVALADKLDTLVGFFAIDEKPTGSKDPFALRRAALGVIRLVLENGRPLSTTALLSAAIRQHALRLHTALNDITDDLIEFEKAPSALKAIGNLPFARWMVEKDDLGPLLKGFDDELDFDEGTIKATFTYGRILAFLAYAFELKRRYKPDVSVQYADVLGIHMQPDAEQFIKLVLGQEVAAEKDFFADRLKVLLRDQGKRHDLVDAVFALGDDDLVRIVRRVEALDAFLAADDGANLLAGYKRASNILKAEEKKGPLPTGMVETGLSGQPAEETALAFAAAAVATSVDAALADEDFAAAMTALAGLRAPVDAFFTGVMVNSDVPAQRENRLKLLGQVRAVMGRVADFGQIAG